MMTDGGEIPILAAAFVVVFLLLRFFNQNGVKGDVKRHPPSLSVLTILWKILRGGMGVLPEYFMSTADKLGPIFSFKVGKQLVVVVNGHRQVFDGLTRHADAFAHKDGIWVEENIGNINQKGILFGPYNDLYKKNHKMSLSILKEFGYGIERVTETRILQEVELMNEKLLKLNGRAFDPKRSLAFATSSVVLSILFGGNFLQSSPKELSTIVECSTGYVANMDVAINMAPFLRFLPFFRHKVNGSRTFHHKLMKSIERGISFIKSNDSEATFIGRVLEIEGTDYSHEDLLYVLRDMCLASAETVSTTMQWALVELANHPQVQDRIQREIDEMVPRDRFPSLDDKPRLPYTEAVLHEVTRRHVIGPFYIRNTSLREANLLEYDIPQGCMVIMNAYSAHMDRTIWKDPYEFRPDRFLDSDNRIINSEELLSFGQGKRSCIGEILGRQSFFLFLTSLVQRFNIRPPEGQKSINATEVVGFTTPPSHFEVRLIPRMKSV